MDRTAALVAAIAIPALAVVFYTFTRIMPPFLGYVAGLAVYWLCVLTPLLIWRGGFRRHRLRLIWPTPWLTVSNFAPICAVAIVATVALIDNPLPIWILAAVALAALTNGTLEELFWRGTVLRDDATAIEQGGQFLLFVGWHLALLFATGVHVTGGAIGLLGGAALGGILWTMARIQTGTVGFAVLCHIGLNLFAFAEIAARNVF